MVAAPTCLIFSIMTLILSKITVESHLAWCPLSYYRNKQRQWAHLTIDLAIVKYGRLPLIYRIRLAEVSCSMIKINDAVSTPFFKVGQVNEIEVNSKGVEMARVRAMGSDKTRWFKLDSLTLLWHASNF